MPVTDKGACEWFVWDLRRSNLIDRGQIDQLVSDFLKKQPGAEPPALAEHLVEQGILSPFQAQRLLEGKTQGLVLGPYTLVDALGSGSMGTVYKAQSKNDNQWYAVKVLPRRSMWNVRIARRLVRAYEQTRHPAVVPFTDVGTAGGQHYLAWPLVEGETLDKIIERDGKLGYEKAARYALQTAEGLEVCHQEGIFHGLLKPSNLMIGLDQQVRILDFGIGSLLADSEGESLVDTMSTANSLTSGLDCASPESIMDPTKRTPAGDQYSLGCILYYCLTGRYPFGDVASVEKLLAHQAKQPPPIRGFSPQVPESLVAIVDQLMEKSPEARYARIADLISALARLANESPRATRPNLPPGRGVAARGTNGHAAPVAAVPQGAPVAATAPRPPSPPAAVPTRQSIQARATAPEAPTPEPVPEAIPLDRANVLASPRESKIGFFGLTMTLLLLGAVSWLAWMVLHP